jgi:hypothetical protein
MSGIGAVEVEEEEEEEESGNVTKKRSSIRSTIFQCSHSHNLLRMKKTTAAPLPHHVVKPKFSTVNQKIKELKQGSQTRATVGSGRRFNLYTFFENLFL